MNINNPTFFIGYDSKEDIAYRVCKQSLLKKSSIKINVLALKLYELVAEKIIIKEILILWLQQSLHIHVFLFLV